MIIVATERDDREVIETVSLTFLGCEPIHLVATGSGMSRPATEAEIALIEQSTTETTGASK